MRRTVTRTTARSPRKPGWGAGGKSVFIPLAALAATTMLAQGDQSSLSQAVNGIQHEFHTSDGVLGLIPFLMAVAGGVGAIPVGVFADRHRRTWLLGAVCALWAVLMGVGALAVGITVLFAARLLVGVTEGTPPVSISLLSDYVQVRRRSEAMGVYQAGAIVGAFIGLIGGGYAVQIGGWFWAFLIWVPIGAVVAFVFIFLHEPGRGHQEAAFEAVAGPGAEGPQAAALAAEGLLALPRPRQVTHPDEITSQMGALRALLRIPTMWLGTMFFTVSQLLLTGLSFWGVLYFERVHHLGPAAAGELSTLLGVGSAVGIISGGTIADRLLRRGHVNARVYVAGLGAIGATLVLAPAFASTNLLMTAPLLFLGGVFLTIPIAPGEALCTDVVPPQLRGRGAMVRQVVRTASFTGPYLIGVISDQIAPNTGLGLRWAIVAACPLYALGGLIMLVAARYYPRDIATVIAQCKQSAAVTPEEACAEAVVEAAAAAVRAEAAGNGSRPGAAELETAAPLPGADRSVQSAPAPGRDS
jgi:MFS family permease